MDLLFIFKPADPRTARSYADGTGVAAGLYHTARSAE
jgi:hypothetical protein